MTDYAPEIRGSLRILTEGPARAMALDRRVPEDLKNFVSGQSEGHLKELIEHTSESRK